LNGNGWRVLNIWAGPRFHSFPGCTVPGGEDACGERFRGQGLKNNFEVKKETQKIFKKLKSLINCPLKYL